MYLRIRLWYVPIYIYELEKLLRRSAIFSEVISMTLVAAMFVSVNNYASATVFTGLENL